MARLNVIGMDPSMSNWGLACGQYDTTSNTLSLRHIEVIKTSKTKDKQIRVNSDDLNRSTEITTRVMEVIKEANVIFVEVPVGSQSAAAMKSYGMCIGILSAVRASGKPFHLLTPTDLKVMACNSKTASKDAMIEWAVKKYPHLNWPMTSKGEVIASKAEHMADACAAAEYGVFHHNDFKLALAMLT
ncbi:hypothetical protein [Pseudomonas phage vB_PaeP_4029]|uniref:Uncharacterized protein n=3 Tax=Litunavirus Ab09 TaxID=1920765 RepID=A0A2K8I3M1_9CAUD|nr:hypothetical protein BI066_gp58 [Pseudomonas phage PEV2]AIZ94815.1 hypothetical protein [Pseudomonas phage RWG]ASZ72114.1 hypothetical protein vBPaePPYO2_00065 [Pseudomonas phage vB_PaeP_PYO2]ASZ72272.1 hypothetical protein vBPaePDEV_00065 [Pseudomonas phage vB_PaeP_DEV]UNY40771.1 putative holliday junction resolvase [Pseudomonas phage CMS1]UYE96398.1 hypothetical protein [Pseudomonas phage vB_PaeP_4029]